MSVIRLIVRRLFLALSTLALVSLVIFAMVEWLPGDVAKQVLGRFASPESIALLQAKLGLNEPAYIRYLAWLERLATLA
jgi:peptide/nickel transport system permease protein